MSIFPLPGDKPVIDYPTSDGKPMAESEWHRDLMIDLIKTLADYFAHDPMVYVSGNLLLYYEEGNIRKRVAPDVFVVQGVKKHSRDCFLLWEEKRSPSFVIEVTSSKTKKEDTVSKFSLYRDLLAVTEYFLFDLDGDYLQPSLQGWRLQGESYQPIRPIAARLPSKRIGLHLERAGRELRFWNPTTESWIPSYQEKYRAAIQYLADDAKRKEEILALQQAEERQHLLMAENARLRRLLKEAGIHPDDIP